MPDPVIAAQQRSELRTRAHTRLTGLAGVKGSPANASNALAVLHELASSPATAADALALLHELQVHQVELDMQAEDLRESRLELELALRRQIELYDFQPVGSFSIDRGALVHVLNLAGARMLGVDRDEALGLPLAGFLSASSARALFELISVAEAGQACDAPTLQLISKSGTTHEVQAHISADPSGQRFLLVLANAGQPR